MDNIKREIKRLVKMLRDNGASEEEIRELFKEEKKQLERLVVTNDHKLFVGEKEVLLRPICMAVYLLFLRHPEGIRFKELPDYREELAKIYHSMKRKTQAKKKVERSIIDVTNPLNHSIIEKCARIKNAFKQITPHEDYVITGEKGEVRRIALDRNLVVWEEKSPPE